MWVLLPLNHAPNISFSFRHIVPLVFVSTLLLLGGLSPFFPLARQAFVSILILYFLPNFYTTLRISLRERNLVYLFTLPLIFFFLHISYGLGSTAGLFRLLAMKLKQALRISHEKSDPKCA